MQSKNENLLVQYYKLCVAIRAERKEMEMMLASGFCFVTYAQKFAKVKQMEKAKIEIRNFIRGGSQ